MTTPVGDTLNIQFGNPLASQTARANFDARVDAARTAIGTARAAVHAANSRVVRAVTQSFKARANNPRTVTACDRELAAALAKRETAKITLDQAYEASNRTFDADRYAVRAPATLSSLSPENEQLCGSECDAALADQLDAAHDAINIADNNVKVANGEVARAVVRAVKAADGNIALALATRGPIAIALAKREAAREVHARTIEASDFSASGELANAFLARNNARSSNGALTAPTSSPSLEVGPQAMDSIKESVVAKASRLTLSLGDKNQSSSPVTLDLLSQPARVEIVLALLEEAPQAIVPPLLEPTPQAIVPPLLEPTPQAIVPPLLEPTPQAIVPIPLEVAPRQDMDAAGENVAVSADAPTQDIMDGMDENQPPVKRSRNPGASTAKSDDLGKKVVREKKSVSKKKKIATRVVDIETANP